MSAQKFSRYEIREELGVGGMATVYRAYDPMFEREVAVKILKKELLEDPQVRERFERETKIIARLEHAAIVPVYDVGFDNGQLFYVMRHMSGGSLSERIESGLGLNDIAYIILRIGSALDYAHHKGVVHRDLKPGNILFDENNNPFISDFGIAKFAQAATKITHSGIIGTPRYISPEQARGDDADGRSDLYSLGVILYEMLSGKTPFEATTPLAMAFKHAVEPAPSILKINPNLPTALDTILEKVLAKQPDERYNTSAEFANAVLEVLPAPNSPEANFITPLPPARARQIAETPTQLPNKVPTPAPEPIPQPAPSRSWMTGGILLLALIGFALLGYSQFGVAGNTSTFTPEPATPTHVSATPTTLPTYTPSPTETVAPTLAPVALPGLGGADKIAVTANNDVYIMDIDGRNIQQLTNTNIPKFDLQWLTGGDELLYGEGRCVYEINVTTSQPKPEQVVCFTNDQLEGFRVSPDGKYVAVSIENRLLIVPYHVEWLSTVTSAFELQNSKDACLDYADISTKRALWSADGKSLAVLYQSVVGSRIGDTIRIIGIDLVRCKDVDPLILDEIPGRQFTPEGYERYPILPSYQWDGISRIVFNTFKRNAVYGELYLYDTATGAEQKYNPIGSICCYQSAAFSPDGTYILLVFQNENRGADGEAQLYYIPVAEIGSGTAFTPLRLPLRFFPNSRESIGIALRLSTP